jgi:UPF0755 protein
MIIGAALFVCSVFAVGAGYKFVRFWVSTPNQGVGPVKAVFYEVRGKESPGQIASELEKAGVISNARLFYWYGRLTGKSRKIKSGDYRFTSNMRPTEVMALIMSGISYGTPLTVPEGYNMKQVSEVVESVRPGTGARFLELCSDRKFIATLGLNPAPANLEGYLFPETYLVGRKTSNEDIIRAMVKKLRSVFTADLEKRAREIGFTTHQVITMASIVEKETGAKQERPLISSVFHNRLKKHMRLQSDPTVIYGLKDYDGNITRKHLEAPTAYNTYTIPALPPGPIANPGKEAITAVLYPAESNFLFFVSHNDGTHEFTVTYEDHRKAVGKFQLDPKAREGKSWRDLNKKPASN